MCSFKKIITHILSTLFCSTSVLFSCTPFGTKSYIYIILGEMGLATGCEDWTSQLWKYLTEGTDQTAVERRLHSGSVPGKKEW